MDIDQPGLVQSNRGLGAQDLQQRLIDARFGNLPTADGTQQSVVRAIEVERQKQHVITRLYGFDRGAASRFGSLLRK